MKIKVLSHIFLISNLLIVLSACSSGGGLYLKGSYCKADLTQDTDIEDKDNQNFKKASLEIADLPLGEYTYQSSDMLVASTDGKFKILGQEKVLRNETKSTLGCVRGDEKKAFDYSINGIERFIVNPGGKVLIDTKTYRIHTNAGPQDKINFDVSDPQASSAAKPGEVYQNQDVVQFYQHKTDANVYEIRSSVEENGTKIMLTTQFRRVDSE